MIGFLHFLERALVLQKGCIMCWQQADVTPTSNQCGDGFQPERHRVRGIGQQGCQSLAMGIAHPCDDAIGRAYQIFECEQWSVFASTHIEPEFFPKERIADEILLIRHATVDA